MSSNISGNNTEDDYSYTFLYNVSSEVLIFLSVLYGVISVLAVAGNSLVIWVILSAHRMQTVTNYFIANLALADIAIGLFSIPFEFQAAVLQRWILPQFMCPFCPFIQTLSINVSIFTMTALAIERHKAITKPIRSRVSKSRAKMIIMGIWFFSTILALPLAFVLRVVTRTEKETTGDWEDIPFCDVVHVDHMHMVIYRWTLVVLQYIIPLCVICVMYLKLGIALWGSSVPGNAENTRDALLLKNKKKVIKMLVIVVTLFAFCWLPLQIYNFLQDVYSEINEYPYINVIWFVCDWIAMSNSCYNPFVYGICNERFKHEFKKIRWPFNKNFRLAQSSFRSVNSYPGKNSFLRNSSKMSNRTVE